MRWTPWAARSARWPTGATCRSEFSTPPRARLCGLSERRCAAVASWLAIPPALRGLTSSLPLLQTDKLEYSREMRKVLESTPNLDIREGQAVDLEVNANDEVTGVVTFFGITFRTKSVVLTTGTFMNGRIWVGKRSMEAGRAGEGPSKGLTDALKRLGFETGRWRRGLLPCLSVIVSESTANPSGRQIGSRPARPPEWIGGRSTFPSWRSNRETRTCGGSALTRRSM